MTNRKSHAPFWLVPKSTTFDDLEWPICTPLQKSYVFWSPPQKIWMKVDPYCPQQKCRSMTLACGGLRFMRIFSEVPWGGGVKWQWGSRQQQFSAFLLAFFGYFWDEASVIIWRYAVRRRLSVIPKCMTLNDLDWFRVKFCFCAGLAGWERATSENNCVKTNKDRHITVSGVYLRQGL